MHSILVGVLLFILMATEQQGESHVIYSYPIRDPIRDPIRSPKNSSKFCSKF